jgi:hypothetical protein
MSSYSPTIRRCHHIKVNGIQCASPALRDQSYCYFHKRWHEKSMDVNMNVQEKGTITLPTLEDANSIQVGLAEVMRLLVSNQIEHRTAALLLRALRTAALNRKHTSFEPDPTLVVIDRESVEHRPLGATAWSAAPDREYDDVAEVEAQKIEAMKAEAVNIKAINDPAKKKTAWEKAEAAEDLAQYTERELAPGSNLRENPMLRRGAPLIARDAMSGTQSPGRGDPAAFNP